MPQRRRQFCVALTSGRRLRVVARSSSDDECCRSHVRRS
jgi:hypothetical protein